MGRKKGGRSVKGSVAVTRKELGWLGAGREQEGRMECRSALRAKLMGWLDVGRKRKEESGSPATEQLTNEVMLGAC